MATWKAVSKLLGIPVSDLGGGIYGILVEVTPKKWFQVGDVTGTLGWTIDDEDGKNYGFYSSEYKLGERTSEFVARLVKGWAADNGYTL